MPVPAVPSVDAFAGAPVDAAACAAAGARDAAAVTGSALLNCLVRELSVPERQTWPAGPYLVIRLARLGVVLRTVARWPPAGPSWRLGWPPEELCADGRWRRMGWRRLAEVIAGELELATGTANPEFAGQVADSHAAVRAILRARAAATPPADPYLASEQALVAGHRFHPTPKAREGEAETWLPYAPEAHARFPLRWLAVRADAVVGEGDFRAVERLGPPAPAGYRTLPAHPWQLRRLAPRLAAARRGELLVDLGPGGPEAVPTSSVRTVYLPDADVYCKFSLDMRITNCVRKNAWYELAGSALLSRLLAPIFDELGVRFDGCALLPEPAHRSVALADRACHEGLAVIVRTGVRGRVRPGLTPLLAAAVADPGADGPAAARTLLTRGLPRADPAAGTAAGTAADPARGTAAGGDRPRAVHVLAWWDAYVRRLLPPVLHAFREYGVVLEAHLQNVLVAVDAAGMPAQMIFRDLEGTKLVADRHARTLAELPPRVREAVGYDTERGWTRVVYCLFVNHLAEVAATLADLVPQPDLEARLWQLVRHHVHAYARRYGRNDGRLRGLAAGVPLPAKANLLTRWARLADRRAGTVPVANPLGGA